MTDPERLQRLAQDGDPKAQAELERHRVRRGELIIIHTRGWARPTPSTQQRLTTRIARQALRWIRRRL